MIFYVYKHIRLDTNTVFYVGKGKHNRAWSKKNRNTYWKNIVSVYGYKIEIVFNDLNECDAFKKEIELIEFYKKQNQCEANLTNGGEGSSGWNPPNEWINKCKERNSGKNNPMYGKVSAMKGRKHSEETKIKMRIARNKKPTKEKPNKVYKKRDYSYLIGKKHSEEHKKKISLNNPNNKKVVDTNTNVIYSNIKEAATAFNMNSNTLKSYLSGRRTNKTSLKYLD